MSLPEWSTLSIFLLIGTALVWVVSRIMRLTRQGQIALAVAKKSREHARRGHVAEREAQQVLESMGFKVLDKQVETEIGWWSDQDWYETTITADYLVKRNGHTAIVEVKTGKESKATHRHTRRQLLEYRIAFSVDHIYLFDGERQQLSQIDFDPMLKGQNSYFRYAIVLGSGCFLGFFIGYYLSH